jgi:hypothetical protein
LQLCHCTCFPWVVFCGRVAGVGLGPGQALLSPDLEGANLVAEPLQLHLSSHALDAGRVAVLSGELAVSRSREAALRTQLAATQSDVERYQDLVDDNEAAAMQRQVALQVGAEHATRELLHTQQQLAAAVHGRRAAEEAQASLARANSALVHRLDTYTCTYAALVAYLQALEADVCTLRTRLAAGQEEVSRERSLRVEVTADAVAVGAWGQALLRHVRGVDLLECASGCLQLFACRRPDAGA